MTDHGEETASSSRLAGGGKRPQGQGGVPVEAFKKGLGWLVGFSGLGWLSGSHGRSRSADGAGATSAGSEEFI